MTTQLLWLRWGAASPCLNRSLCRMNRWPGRLLAAVAFLVLIPTGSYSRSVAVFADQVSETQQPSPEAAVLSSYWGPDIQRMQGPIGGLAETYGFHPDFIAAIIRHESDQEWRATAHGSMVGLMAMLPTGEKVEWRPSSEQLLVPTAHLRWGLAILSYVVQQSGGDLYTALAAYQGGWEHLDERAPREYAARVLDSYGRALITRNGLSPDMANRWTIAVQIRAGNVPAESLLILGNKPIGLRTYAEHTVYAFAGQDNRTYYVRAYVVPLGLSQFVAADTSDGFDQLEAPLRARLGEKSARGGPDARVLLACLSGLERLRGEVTTRWFSPSSCPAAGR